MRGGLGLVANGLRLLQIFAGVAIVALAGIDDPLEAFEGGAAGGESVAMVGLFDFSILLQEKVVGGQPEVGFDAAQAAETPFVVDHGVDQETLVGVGGAVEFVVFGGEFSEIFGRFGEHDLLLSMDAVLEGVETGLGLPCFRDWTLGLLTVGSAGCALSACGHIRFLNDDLSRAVDGLAGALEAKWLVMSEK